MEFSKIPILELLPQRPPFVLVDRLMHYSPESTVCQFMVPEEHLFVEEGRLTSCGMIENIAQTCAARIGYYNKYVLKRGIRLGFIGSIRDMQIVRTPCVGELLTTSIDVQEEVFGMTLAKANIKVGDEVIASTEMKIAESDVESKQ